LPPLADIAFFHYAITLVFAMLAFAITPDYAAIDISFADYAFTLFFSCHCCPFSPLFAIDFIRH